MLVRELVLGLLLLPAVIPPLTAEQQTRLDTAFDGRDHREEAFVALVENARVFTGVGEAVAGASPVRLEPDVDTLLADPDAHRGALCRLTGVLQQATPLPRPHAEAWEWFVRDTAGRPVLVYVVGLTPPELDAFRPGRPVAIYGRFYKRVDATARDGEPRSYAAFVGARPWRPAGVASGSPSTPVVIALAAIVLLGMVVVLIMLSVAARRRPRLARRGFADGNDATDVDESGSLPDDPAEALAELRRRAEARN